MVERFSTCHLIKTKVITVANQSNEEHHKRPKRTQRTNKEKKLIEVRKKGDQVVNGLTYKSDWFRRQLEFSRPVTEQS